MSYRWVEHTAEVELEIEVLTEESIFTDALHALGELVGDACAGRPLSCELTVQGHDRALLLAEWLDELVYRVETEDLIPEDVERIKLGERSLTATVLCRRGSPRHLGKGVTHHHLAFEHLGHGFRATVPLDHGGLASVFLRA